MSNLPQDTLPLAKVLAQLITIALVVGAVLLVILALEPDTVRTDNQTLFGRLATLKQGDMLVAFDETGDESMVLLVNVNYSLAQILSVRHLINTHLATRPQIEYRDIARIVGEKGGLVIVSPEHRAKALRSMLGMSVNFSE